VNIDNAQISLAHVHAYIDAQLNDEDCLRLEDYFDANPDKFEQLQRYLAINDHYQAIYDPIIKEAIPENIFDSLYNAKNDPFQSGGNNFGPVARFFSTVLFAKPSVWMNGFGQRLYHLLRIERLNINTQFFASLPTPAWINRYRNQMSAMFAKIGNSYGEVNLFAVLSIASIGIMIGMSLGGESHPAAESSTVQNYAASQAIQAHVFYGGEGRPTLETDMEKQQQLLSWLSERSGKAIRIIDFSELGYHNAGMTLVPSMDNYSLITVYKDAQSQSLTLYVGLKETGKSEEFLCTSGENSKSTCAWANGKLQFVVVSDLALADTQQVAEWMRQNYSMAHLISSSEYFFSQTFGTTRA
jgi:anti-sigma factor RsiW